MGTHFIALGLVSIAVRYDYFIKVSLLSMTCVNALVLFLRHSDAPFKKSKNTKISRLFIGSDVLGFYCMI